MSIIIKPELKETINEAFKKLLRSVGVYDVGGFDFSDSLNNGIEVPLETSAAITLYVDAAGSDSNDGSLAHPLLTIQAAVDRVPKRIKHPVNINVGAGTFKGASVSGFTFTPEISGWLAINGTFVLATVDGLNAGTATGGTAGSGLTGGTLVKTGAGWTVDQLKGKIVKIVAGTGSTSVVPYAVIRSNTADTITIIGSWTAPNATSQFQICDWGTVVNDGPVIPQMDPTVAATVTKYGFVLFSNSATNLARIAVIGIHVTSIAAVQNLDVHYVYAPSSDVPKLSGCKSSSWAGTSFTNVKIERCVLDYTALNNVTGATNCYCSYSLFMGNTNCYGVSATLNKGVTILSCVMDSLKNGYYGLGGTLTSMSTSILSNCTKALASVSGVYNGATTSSFIDCGVVLETNAQVPGVKFSFWDCIGTGNTTVITATAGVEVLVNSGCTLTGTTEILLDGVAKTFAEMRAGTPKYLTNATTGTRVWGD